MTLRVKLTMNLTVSVTVAMTMSLSMKLSLSVSMGLSVKLTMSVPMSVNMAMRYRNLISKLLLLASCLLDLGVNCVHFGTVNNCSTANDNIMIKRFVFVDSVAIL